jgi:hypothetical protein
MTEPFAWFRYQWGDRVYHDSKKWDDCQPLYTYPKEWVGLTDEEVELYWDWEDFQCGCGKGTLLEMVRDIEAKLKELNT